MPDVRQTISDFYRVAQERDFSRDFQFRVLNIQSGDGSFRIVEDDLVYAKGGSIPGRTINVSEIPYMGLNFRVPGGATYTGEYTLQFYSDRVDSLRTLLLNWTRDTFDDATSTGNYFIAKETSIVDLVQLDTQLNRVSQFTLVGAFPISVGDVAYDPSGNGAPVEFEVNLGYQYVRSQKFQTL